mgnify:CR=1 FL=1
MRAVWFIGKFELLLNCTKYPIYSPKSRTPQQPQNVSSKPLAGSPEFKNLTQQFTKINFVAWNLKSINDYALLSE